MPRDMKNFIERTFYKMMERKSIDKITIKDLVEACNISRQAFYYHFKDIMDVIEYGLEKDINEMLAKDISKYSLEQALGTFIYHITENTELIERQISSRRREELVKIIVKSIKMYLQELFKQKIPEKKITYEQAEMILDFYSCGIGAFLIDRYEKTHTNSKEIAHELSKLILAGIMSYVDIS